MDLVSRITNNFCGYNMDGSSIIKKKKSIEWYPSSTLYGVQALL